MGIPTVGMCVFFQCIPTQLSYTIQTKVFFRTLFDISEEMQNNVILCGIHIKHLRGILLNNKPVMLDIAVGRSLM